MVQIDGPYENYYSLIFCVTMKALTDVKAGSIEIWNEPNLDADWPDDDDE